MQGCADERTDALLADQQISGMALHTWMECRCRRGNFKVQYSPDGAIEVFTEKKARHYSFTQDGHLVASERIPRETFSSLPTGEMVVVPTAPLFWVFSTPFLSLGVAVIGSIGLAILKKIDDRAPLPTTG
jgi:hypothetical protein